MENYLPFRHDHGGYEFWMVFVSLTLVVQTPPNIPLGRWKKAPENYHFLEWFGCPNKTHQLPSWSSTAKAPEKLPIGKANIFPAPFFEGKLAVKLQGCIWKTRGTIVVFPHSCPTKFLQKHSQLNPPGYCIHFLSLFLLKKTYEPRLEQKILSILKMSCFPKTNVFLRPYFFRVQQKKGHGHGQQIFQQKSGPRDLVAFRNMSLTTSHV